MPKHPRPDSEDGERADDDGEHARGTDGVSRTDSISNHAEKHHPHDGHDGSQDEEHSQPQHGKHHKNM